MRPTMVLNTIVTVGFLSGAADSFDRQSNPLHIALWHNRPEGFVVQSLTFT